jgi:hypothetical protein
MKQFRIGIDATGKDVFFCNLAADPALFEGPTGDVQVLQRL